MNAIRAALLAGDIQVTRDGKFVAPPELDHLLDPRGCTSALADIARERLDTLRKVVLLIEREEAREDRNAVAQLPHSTLIAVKHIASRQLPMPEEARDG